MTKLVTIIGGSGFVGRYIAQRMARAGWRVRVACRHPNDAIFVRPYGVVGQVEPVFTNIRDDDSVRDVVNGADAVVNCVGVLVESGKNTFDAVQSEGAARVARMAQEEGVGAMVHISAIGADIDGESDYARTKGEGEAAVKQHFPDATILRPSIIFGPEDDFFNRFGGMARMMPVVPLVGADTLFQPVWVEDVAKAVEACLTGAANPGVYELGGPDVSSFKELVEQTAEIIRRKRAVVGLPGFVGRFMGWAGDLTSTLTLGIVKPLITRDQVIQLQHDNLVSDGAKGFADLGITPTSLEAVLPGYLWRFRPDGQYNDLTKETRRLHDG